MQKLPAIEAQELLRFLKFAGFADGRVTTVPIHGNQDLPKGLLRKIIREDLEMSLEDFLDLYSDFKGK